MLEPGALKKIIFVFINVEHPIAKKEEADKINFKWYYYTSQT